MLQSDHIKLSQLPSLERQNGQSRSTWLSLRSSRLTFGLEHEFFLASAGSNAPASEIESKQFLTSVLSSCGGEPVSRTDHFLGDYLFGVRFSDVVCKYEHYPNLMELEFPPSDRLESLRPKIFQAFRVVKQAANDSGLVALHWPRAPWEADHAGAVVMTDQIDSLWTYRRALHKGNCLSTTDLNFSAVIASSQLHVGGIDWLEHDYLVDRLYRLEADAGKVAWEPYRKRGQDLRTLTHRRWEGYERVCRKLPLYGFPDFDRWTTEAWRAALRRSPLAMKAGAMSGDLTYAGAIGRGMSELEAMARVRDLQIIKPRSFGTLEFRADPAQPDVGSLIELISARVEYVRNALEYEPARTYSEARVAWRNMMFG